MIDALADFHFLRPWWLLAFPVTVLLMWLNRQFAARQDWERFIAPHLLRAILVKREASSFLGPIPFALLQSIFWVLALAGPAWEPVDDLWPGQSSPLVIALELSPAMQKDDLQPSRLNHAQLKIADLLDRRKGSETALIVYAGSAHTVVPLTEDTDILSLYLNDLTPRVMPQPGMDLSKAYRLAGRLLGEQAAIGTVLFVGSGELTGDWPLPNDAQKESARAIYWQMAIDNEPLASAQPITLDSADVDSIARTVNRKFSPGERQKTSQQWRDGGYYLVFPVVLLALLFFRRGMVIQWR